MQNKILQKPVFKDFITPQGQSWAGNRAFFEKLSPNLQNSNYSDLP